MAHAEHPPEPLTHDLQYGITIEVQNIMERKVYNTEDYHMERIQLTIVRELYYDGFIAYHLEISDPASYDRTPVHAPHATMKEAWKAYKAALHTLRYQGFTSFSYIQFDQRRHNQELTA